MRNDMRTCHGDGVRIAGRDDRADHMPAPEPASHRIGNQPVAVIKTVADRAFQQTDEMNPPLRTEGGRIERNHGFDIGAIQASERQAVGDCRGFWRRNGLALTLKYGPLRSKAERDVEAACLTGRVETNMPAGTIRKHTFHQPSRSAVRLQSGRGNQHAESGKLISMRKPHGGRGYTSDLVERDEAVADIACVLPIGRPMRPSDGNRQCLKL